MKVALVHDYLREYGGAERVVEVLHELYPDAPLYTSFVDWQSLGAHAARFKNWDIRTTWVQHNWLMRKFHSPLRFLTPLVWESLDLREFDLVISSSGWFICRGVVTKPETLHISYIHHPPRNLYHYPTGRTQNFFFKLYAFFVNPFLRMYDYATMQRVDEVVANSKETAARIQKFYRRSATVIYPPVEISNIKLPASNVKKEYFLSVGRLTYAKRVDLAIRVCNELKLPLKIVGTGKEYEYLKTIAGNTIEFLGDVSDSELAQIYANARALIFCALQEDFGMVPVEAMGNGTPVVALMQGGVIETVIEDKTGVFFDEATTTSLKNALEKFMRIEKKITPQLCRKQAEKFSKKIFMDTMKKFVEKNYQKHSQKMSN